MEKICIIVPVYNREATLERCVNSIIKQSFTDWTLLLIDDGSTDTGVQMCDEFAERDSRIKVIHKANGGVSSARNAGLDWAFANDQSEWLAFIDSDDWVCTTYFQRLLEAAVLHQADISCCNYINTSTNAIYNQGTQISELIPTELYWRKYPSPSVVPWGKIYRKFLFADIRYPLGKICDDTFTSHKVLFKRDKIAWTDEKLYCYYISPDGISRARTATLCTQWSEAYEEQAVFFHEKKMVGLRDTALRRMLDSTKQAIKRAEIERDNSVTKRMKTELKRRIKWIKNELNIPLYAHEYIYEAVMPRRAALSRKWRHFKMRVRSILIH